MDTKKIGIVIGVCVVALIAGIFLYTKQMGNKDEGISEYTPADIITEKQEKRTELKTEPQTKPETEKKAEPTKELSDPKSQKEKPMEINPSKSYTATLKTSQGEIVVKLNADKTPITVNNFVTLAKKGFYNNTTFHRAIKDFMIQGGDPKGDGTGGPGYTFADEKFEGSYVRGTLAMANAGPNTNGSQFFIMHQDVPLPPNYVIFGSVTSGMDVVDKIASTPVVLSPSGEKSKPATPITVTSVEIKEQ